MSRNKLPPSGLVRRVCDIALEVTGTYRFFMLARKSTIGLSVRVASPSRLSVGYNVTVQRGAILHCGGKAWCANRGHIRLGDGVTIGPYCVVYGAGGVELEDHVHLGPGAKIMSQAGAHDDKRLSAHPTFLLDSVHIGAGSWIGAGAVILGGSRIGKCVSVAPNSVVFGEVPDYAVIAGNPARVVFKNKAID